MRVLVITPVAPCTGAPPGGAQTRVRELLLRLARKHEIEVLALSPEGRAAPDEMSSVTDIDVRVWPRSRSRRNAFCRSLVSRDSVYVHLHESPAFGAAVADAVRAKRFDLVQCEFPYMAQYCQDLGLPWILVEHNIEFGLSARLLETSAGLAKMPYRWYARRETARRKREELRACAKAAAVVVMSEVDRATLLRHIPGLCVAVVPNGVDLDHYRFAGFDGCSERADPPSGVFIGRMDYRPNIDGAKWFCRSVLPLIRCRIPSFTVSIVGAEPDATVAALDDVPGVQVVGEVADTRPYLANACLVVVPLGAGSGTRLKILEAFAVGRPVVSTSIGCEGLEAIAGEHLLVADTTDGFADCVVNLIESPARRRAVAEAARSLAEQRYGWDRSAALLERVYFEVLARAGVQAASGSEGLP